MASVGRFVMFMARAGQADALAQALLTVADSLRAAPGCQLYVINRVPDKPDSVCVTEIWSSQESVDASLQSLQTEAGRTQLAQITALLEGPPTRIDLEPLGGVGFPPPGCAPPP
jgi:quinol monooxygenase YgiN